MKHILCKILLHNKTHPVVAASFMIIGAYIGYLIWYILDSYLPAAAADNGYVFVSLIIGFGSARFGESISFLTSCV